MKVLFVMIIVLMLMIFLVDDAGASDVDVDNYVADLVVIVITNDCVNHSDAYEDNDINNNNQTDFS